MHIEFDIEDSKIRYEAGDHLAVYPVNNAELVNKIGEQCGASLDTVFTLTNTDGKLFTFFFMFFYLLFIFFYCIYINLLFILQRNPQRSIHSLVLVAIELL